MRYPYPIAACCVALALAAAPAFADTHDDDDDDGRDFGRFRTEQVSAAPFVSLLPMEDGTLMEVDGTSMLVRTRTGRSADHDEECFVVFWRCTRRLHQRREFENASAIVASQNDSVLIEEASGCKIGARWSQPLPNLRVCGQKVML